MPGALSHTHEAAFRDAEARERLAEAEARATQMVSDAIAIAIANGSVQAINYFVAQKYVEAFNALATAPNQKLVLMPMESSGIIGSIAGIAELAKEAAGKPDAPVRVPPMPPRAGACAMRWDVAVWAMLALLLIAAETLGPGAFLLWMGIAAAAVRVLVLVLPNIALLWQVVAFVLLSFVSVQVYRTWFRSNGRQSDRRCTIGVPSS